MSDSARRATRGYLPVSCGQMHYAMLGRGPAVLLLHPSPESGALWLPLLPALAAAGRTALAPDLPGYGASDPPAQTPALEDYARLTLEFLDGHGITRCDLVGHHTGAAVGLQLAACWPDRVRRMVLWGVPLLNQRLSEQLSAEEAPSYDAEGEALKAWWIRRRSFLGEFREDVLIRSTVEMLQTGHRRPWGHWAVARADMPALLARVAHPTLVLVGERDPVWSRAQEAAGRLAGGSFRAMPGAGMDIVDQAPDELARLVIGFLAEDQGSADATLAPAPEIDRRRRPPSGRPGRPSRSTHRRGA